MSSEVEAAAPAPEMEVPATETIKEVVAKEEKTVKRGRKQKSVKELKKKPATPCHPPYFQMIKEAMVALNEKGGSSPYAIAKYMEEKHKAVLPSNFRKILGLQLKNSVSKGKLIKIRASYKLSEAGKKKRAATTTKAARANAAKEPAKRRKPKSRAVSKIDNPPSNPTVRRSKRSSKPKQLKTIKSPGVTNSKAAKNAA